jgi:hypothetical protein
MSIIITILILLLCHTPVWSADRQFTVEYVEPVENAEAANQQFQLKSVGTDTFQLIANHSGKCLEIVGGSTANGASMQQNACSTGNHQRFRVTSSPSTLVAVHSGKCIDVAGVSTSDGATVVQWTCHGGPNQQWAWSIGGTTGANAPPPAGLTSFTAAHSQKCLEIPGSSQSNGAAATQSSCTGDPSPLTDLDGTIIYTDVISDGNPAPDIIVVPASSSSGGGQITQTVCVPVRDETTATHINVFVTAFDISGNESLATPVVQWPVAGKPACDTDTVPPAMPSNITVTQP